MTRFLLVLATAIGLSSPAAVGNFAPEDDLYLVCGGYLVVVTTTWKQKAANAVGAQGENRSEITADVVPLFRDTKVRYPEADILGWAYEETIIIGNSRTFFGDSWMLDRIEGTLIRTKNPNKTTQENAVSILRGERETYREVVATCRSSSEAEHRQVVDAHNSKVVKSQPERKF